MNQDRYEFLQKVGCVCCAMNEGFGKEWLGFACNVVPLGGAMRLEVHHLNAGGLHGGKRLGDDKTIPLCGWHHRGVTTGISSRQMIPLYGPSWAGGSKPFRACYGSDAELLARANQDLKDEAV